MGSAATPLPYQNVTTTSDIAGWKKPLYGFTKNAPEYSPYKALARQASNESKMIEGMTSAPKWSSMYAAMGLPEGTDLTPYIQAMRTGTQGPTAPIPASPAADTIPAYVAPSDTTKKAAEGGLMSLRKDKERGFYSGAQIAAYQQAVAKQKAAKKAKAAAAPANAADAAAPTAVPLSQAMNVVTPFYDPTQAQGKYAGITNPIYRQAIDQLEKASQAPGQFGQATDIYGQVAGKSWTDPGVAQSYMNPYIETALKSQEDLANRQFAQQQNQLRSQAAGHGAFGGSASALAQQAAQQNQNMTLKDLVAQGMNQAYQQGMGQFGTEQQQRLGAAGGLGSLGAQQWGLQQQIPQLWGAAGQTAQGIAQQAATGAQQTAQNWWGGIANANQPVANLLSGTPGTAGTQAISRMPGV